MQWHINELRAEVKDIKKKSQALESQTSEVEELNKRLKGSEEEQKAIKTAVSDLLIKVQSLTGELQVLRGHLDETRYFSEKTLKDIVESKDALIAKVKELEITVNELKEKLARLLPPVVPNERQKPAQDDKKTEELKEEKSHGKEAKDVYLEAYQTYKAGKFSEAREKFLSLLKNYPENEYSDNARFWIAESYYKEKNYGDAILAYEELLKRNPQSDKVPMAMLKQGFAFYEMNDQKIGRIILEKLIEKFPASEEAKAAKKKISPPKKADSISSSK